LRDPPGSDTDHVADISREEIDKRKNAPHNESKPQSSKTNIHINSEYHQEEAGYPRIRRKRTRPATQNTQDRLRILQDQMILNERAIQARCTESGESNGTWRKREISVAGKITVILKAKKRRARRPRRLQTPSISSCHASNCLPFRLSLQIRPGDPDGRAAAFRHHQIAFVKDIAESRYNFPVSINALMRAFDCPR
jgi:hypothetical protein